MRRWWWSEGCRTSPDNGFCINQRDGATTDVINIIAPTPVVDIFLDPHIRTVSRAEHTPTSYSVVVVITSSSFVFHFIFLYSLTMMRRFSIGRY